jgi:YidC/Oxa1 family membrane protein insertase
LEPVLATNILLDPIVAFLSTVLATLNQYTHNFGLSLIALAVLVKVVFWPLSAMQFKSIAKMQALQPQLKALQARLKGDPQKLQQEQMALYKTQNVNPFASCLPLLLQMPILWSIYYAIWHSCNDFAQTSFLWIGSSVAKMTPIVQHMNDSCTKGHDQLAVHLLATSLLLPDYFLLALYVVSMYFSVRFSSPALDESQAQQQRIMAFVSPVMIAFIGRQWPSALILYWLTFNVLSTAQQMYMMGRFKKPLPATALAVSTNGAVGDNRAEPALERKASGGGGGSGRARRKRGSRR